MKLLKNSLAVSAITAVLGMFFFVGCDNGKEIEIIKEPEVEKEKSIARIAFYGGGERRGGDEINRYTNAHLENDRVTPRLYTNATHEPEGFGGITIDTAYVLLKYPGLNAGHYSTGSPASAPSLRHAGGWFGLEKDPDPTSNDPSHPICETYAVNIMKIEQQYLGSMEVPPGEYGEPSVRIFAPGSAGAESEKWWNRVKDVDPDKKAKSVLRAKNAGFYIKGRAWDGEGKEYTYEVISNRELGPQTWTGGVGDLPGYTSNGTAVNYWDIGQGKTLHFNIHPHTDHWLGRYREFQVYKDLATLADANNNIVFSAETMAGYQLRASFGTNNPTDATGKTFMELIEAEFFPKQGFDSEFSRILELRADD
jgi:hypothetical protein